MDLLHLKPLIPPKRQYLAGTNCYATSHYRWVCPINQPVKIALTRQREKDPEFNFSQDCVYLSNESVLRAEFEIPDAAAKLVFVADFMRRTINLSMRVDAPKDKSRATASINWLTRQFKGKESGEVSIRAYWPKRIKMTAASLADALEDPRITIPAGVNELPTTLEVVRVIDLAGRFKAVRTFVEESTREFSQFYQDVGQHLSKWVAAPPKIKTQETAGPSIPTIFSNPSDIIPTPDPLEIDTTQLS
jgi:hypothetical protein